jgi:hypothetical protein
MTTAAPSPITATVDTLAGQRLTDATLAVRQIVRLNCGCHRYECDRPGGGLVHVLVGQHCADYAGPDAAVPALAGVA